MTDDLMSKADALVSVAVGGKDSIYVSPGDRLAQNAQVYTGNVADLQIAGNTSFGQNVGVAEAPLHVDNGTTVSPVIGAAAPVNANKIER